MDGWADARVLCCAVLCCVVWSCGLLLARQGSPAVSWNQGKKERKKERKRVCMRVCVCALLRVSGKRERERVEAWCAMRAGREQRFIATALLLLFSFEPLACLFQPGQLCAHRS